MFGPRHCLPGLLFCPATMAVCFALALGLSRDWAALLVCGGWAAAMVVLLALWRRRPDGKGKG